MKLVYLYSTIKMMHGPINIRWLLAVFNGILTISFILWTLPITDTWTSSQYRYVLSVFVTTISSYRTGNCNDAFLKMICSVVGLINLLVPELFFLILAHPVYKMWIIQEPNTLELWNELHFEEKKNGEYIPCLKYSVPIFVE